MLTRLRYSRMLIACGLHLGCTFADAYADDLMCPTSCRAQSHGQSLTQQGCQGTLLQCLLLCSCTSKVAVSLAPDLHIPKPAKETK